jgi:biotin carboxyl carrier protein
VTIDGRPLEVGLVSADEAFASLLVAGESHELGLERQPAGVRVHFRGGSVLVELTEASRRVAAAARRPSGPVRVTAPMPGRVVRVLVAPEASVEVGQGLVVVEAMKMENELRAPRAGRVEQVAVREGQAVEAGALLVVIG